MKWEGTEDINFSVSLLLKNYMNIENEINTEVESFHQAVGIKLVLDTYRYTLLCLQFIQTNTVSTKN